MMRLSWRSGVRGGFALIVVLVMMIVMTSLMLVLNAHLVRARRRVVSAAWTARAFALAEAGMNKALWHISRGDDRYEGEENTRLGSGYFTVLVRDLPGKVDYKEITSAGSLEPIGSHPGHLPDASSPGPPSRPIERVRVVVRVVPAGAAEGPLPADRVSAKDTAPSVRIADGPLPVEWQRFR